MKTAMLPLTTCCYQNKQTILICFFTSGRHSNIDTYFKFQSYYHIPQIIFGNESKINILFRRTPWDIILLFHETAGLDMNLEKRKSLYRKA